MNIGILAAWPLLASSVPLGRNRRPRHLAFRYTGASQPVPCVRSCRVGPSRDWQPRPVNKWPSGSIRASASDCNRLAVRSIAHDLPRCCCPQHVRLITNLRTIMAPDFLVKITGSFAFPASGNPGAVHCAGFNCSIPQKVAVIAHLDGLDKSAEIIGAGGYVIPERQLQ